jgi:hypothetical protein
MALKPGDKIKLALVAGLLLISTSVGLFLFLEWSTAPEPLAQETSATEPSIAAAPPGPVAPSFSDIHKFQKLVQSDDTQHAAEMLAREPALVSVKLTNDHATALHLVSSVAMAKLLLDNGADINALDGHYSATPLRWAASNTWNHAPWVTDLIKFLESRGAKPETDIYFASAVGDISRIQTLLANDPSLINKKSDNNDPLFGGATPIQIAAYADQLETVKFLLDHGASVHDRSEWKNTEPIEKAAWTGAADVVQLLIDRGAKVDGTDSDFRDSPLYNAATSGHADVVRILLAHGAKTSPMLIPGVRDAMASARPGNPNTGTPKEFQEILEMLNAAPAPTR